MNRCLHSGSWVGVPLQQLAIIFLVEVISLFQPLWNQNQARYTRYNFYWCSKIVSFWGRTQIISLDSFWDPEDLLRLLNPLFVGDIWVVKWLNHFTTTAVQYGTRPKMEHFNIFPGWIFQLISPLVKSEFKAAYWTDGRYAVLNVYSTVARHYLLAELAKSW